MYIYLGAELSISLPYAKHLRPPRSDFQSIVPCLALNADAVSVELPNAMECYNPVLKLCKTERNGLHCQCFKTGSFIYSSSSDLLLSFDDFANCSFQTLLALSVSRLGKTRSKTSEYQLTAWPSIPSLMFWSKDVSTYPRGREPANLYLPEVVPASQTYFRQEKRWSSHQRVERPRSSLATLQYAEPCL